MPEIVICVALLLIVGFFHITCRLLATEDARLEKRALKNLDRLETSYPHVIAARNAYYEALEISDKAFAEKERLFKEISTTYNSIVLSDEEKEQALTNLRREYKEKVELHQIFDTETKLRHNNLGDLYLSIEKDRDVILIQHLPHYISDDAVI